MQLQRRISSIFKDVPGGQKLGATYDYIHRLLDLKLAAEDNEYRSPETNLKSFDETLSRSIDTLDRDGLIQLEDIIESSKEPADKDKQIAELNQQLEAIK